MHSLRPTRNIPHAFVQYSLISQDTKTVEETCDTKGARLAHW